jgi:prolyl-tRNA editing enzyme YbaK/EbsC (Cys-tRNA(Pro) deacylase)
MLSSEEIEINLKETLRNLEVIYEWIEVDPEYADTEKFCERYGFTMEESGNTIIVASKRGEKKFAACIVLGMDRLDVNKKVRNLMQVSRLSFANSENTMELTGMMIGGVTPYMLPDSIPLYIDSKIMDLESIILGGGSRSGKLRLSPKELLKIPSAEIIEGLSQS